MPDAVTEKPIQSDGGRCCPVPVWDGPYKMRCGYVGRGLGPGFRECPTHGPFEVRLEPDGDDD